MLKVWKNFRMTRVPNEGDGKDGKKRRNAFEMRPYFLFDISDKPDSFLRRQNTRA